MKSHKVIGLCGLLVSAAFLFCVVGLQDDLSRGMQMLFVVLVIYIGIFSGQYAFTGDKKTSSLSALKITLIVTVIGVAVGLLKLLTN